MELGSRKVASRGHVSGRHGFMALDDLLWASNSRAMLLHLNPAVSNWATFNDFLVNYLTLMLRFMRLLQWLFKRRFLLRFITVGYRGWLLDTRVAHDAK